MRSFTTPQRLAQKNRAYAYLDDLKTHINYCMGRQILLFPEKEAERIISASQKVGRASHNTPMVGSFRGKRSAYLLNL